MNAVRLNKRCMYGMTWSSERNIDRYRLLLTRARSVAIGLSAVAGLEWKMNMYQRRTE